MANPLQTFLTQLGLAAESSWGTLTAPSTADQFIPVSNLKVSDEIETIEDRGLRSRASIDQGYAQGNRFAKISFDSLVYNDVVGNYIRGMLMGTDSVTGAGPFTHTIPILNTGTGPSYTVQDFYGVTGTNTRAYVGCYFESVQFSWTAGANGSGPIKATVSMIGKASQDTALQAKPSATYTTGTPLQPWTGAVTLNSVGSYVKLIGFDLKLSRPVEPIFAAGNQGPSNENAGQLMAAYKLTFAPTDDTELLLFLNNTQGNLVVNYNQASTAQLQFTSTKLALEKPTVIDRSSPYVKIVATGRGIDNATDGGSVKCVLINSKSSAY